MNTMFRNGFAVVATAMLSLGLATPSSAISDWLFPTDQEMRQTIGLRTDSYEFPWHTVMNNAKGWRNAKCSPRYARKALSVGAWSYNLLSGPYGGNIDVTLWKYPGPGLATKAVDTYRQQMSHCKRHRLYLKKVKNDHGFPVRTSGVSGRTGEARMRNKYGDVVDSAEREWMTAVDKYVVQVEAVYWGDTRPPFPPVSMPRDVTAWMQKRLVIEGLVQDK